MSYDDNGYPDGEDCPAQDDPFEVGEANPMRETAKALLVYLEGEQRELWVPKSVIHSDSEVWSSSQVAGELVVFYWWAEKEGLA